ncbi:DNA recombination protein RmuC [Patescibacteria group bacterium]|nr:DNA recombination protein RmuC [Patescibacteria group bacterium]
MNEILFILIIVSIVVGGVAASIFFIKRELEKIRERKEDLALSMVKRDIEVMGKKFENGYREIAKELGEVQEIGRTLRDFQTSLRSPKLRGGIGEQVLKDLLEQVLPNSNFQCPYRFRAGEIVDAIIKTKQGLIPIDSKFPMENFQKYVKAKGKEKESYLKEFVKDIKRHIDDISRKYILPQEGTLDYAIMYIPIESVFSKVTSNPELSEYAHRKKVIVVSPNTFYYFLKIIMIGLEGSRIEEASKKILEGLKGIQQESMRFGKELDTLTSHIGHAKSASDRVQSRYGRLVSRIDGLRLLEPEKKPKEIEEPKEE